MRDVVIASNNYMEPNKLNWMVRLGLITIAH